LKTIVSKLFILFLVGFLFPISTHSQTLIMNEVSNGISGSGNNTQEYVEFVVVSNSVVYNCNSPIPPCIDIRGWIFDDNSGYHGPAGVAAGAVRFSNDALWSCVPLGTIIVIYNGLDRNPAIPPDDLSLTDGNCTIIAPIDNVALFDQNPTTPGAIACSYPATGWVAGGLWANTALANPSDCARIVDLGGCEVFSVCYGAADNLNTLIYFAPVGTNTVYYFNGVNPTLQANWTAAVASTAETPGAPNNAANAAYIAQFNNGCLPITPINVTATFTTAGCTCTGTATATATGSIPGYTYTWFDASFVPIGQTTATATGLCAGIYNVIATSSIGCADTTSVTITGSGASTVTINSPTICIGDTAILTASGATTYTWSAGATVTGVTTATVTPAVTTTYTVTGNTGGCTSTAIATVTVAAVLNVTVNSPSICTGATATLTAAGAATYTWSAGATSIGITTATASPLVTTTYTVTGTSGSCTSTAVATVTVNSSPVTTVNSPAICAGATATLTATGATSYTWSAGATSTGITTATATPLTTTTYTVTGTTAGCSSTAVATVTVNPAPSVTVNSQTICAGATATLTATGATSYTWSAGATSTGITTATASPLITTTYTVTGTTAGCSSTAIATVTINAGLIVVAGTNGSICPGDSVVLTALATFGNGGPYAYNWLPAVSVSGKVSPAVTTTYTVSANDGCSPTATATVTITVLPAPTVVMTANTLSGCAPVCVNFTDASLVAGGTINSWGWNFGDGVLNTTQNPIHCYVNAGSYSVSLAATASNGCTSNAIQNNYINVYPVPEAAFTSNTAVADILNAEIYFTNQSTGASIYEWSFGDMSSSTENNPIHTYNSIGQYSVLLIASNSQGCVDSAMYAIDITGIFTFYAPNAFTPNDDLTNNVFLPKGIGWNLDKYKLMIFDRWGNMCFETSDASKGWDGKANNGSEITQQDVYVWKVELTDVFNSAHHYIGSVTIIK
jgi:trimeric autotransporter adhesin